MLKDNKEMVETKDQETQKQIKEWIKENTPDLISGDHFGQVYIGKWMGWEKYFKLFNN